LSIKYGNPKQLEKDFDQEWSLDKRKLYNQWIGLREFLQENTIFDGKIHGFL